MPIREGWNVLRFVRADEAKDSRIQGRIYDAYKFTAVNLATEEVSFTYLVPKEKKPHGLISDLLHVTASKRWMDVRLKEMKRFWAIEEMKELKNDQAEYEQLKRTRNGKPRRLN